MNMIQSAKDQIAVLTRSAYRAAVQEGLLPDGVETVPAVEIPKDTANGDYTTTFCLAASKAMRKNPREVANILTQHMKLDGTYFTSVEIAGPGFLNFRLGEKWYADVVEDVEREADAYGRGEGLKGKKYMVEFVSANPTGPMHMGNARGGVLGDTLASVLDWSGANVWREFYVNDFGNQIEKFAKSIEARYFQLIKGEDAVEFPEDGYHGDDIKELAQAFYAEHGESYLDKTEAERHADMARFGLDRNIPKMKSDLVRYGIKFDEWFFESSLHESGFVADTAKKLTDLGWTYEKDGALWVKTAEIMRDQYRKQGKKDEDIDKLGLKDDVLRRANGFYTYLAGDIAYHRNKFEVRGFDKVINIWGADHHGHVARLKGAIDALGLDGTNRLDIVLMQLVKLVRDGEVVRMSKRTGKTISLSDLLDEIPAATSSTPSPIRRWTSTSASPCARTARTPSTISSTPMRVSAACSRRWRMRAAAFPPRTRPTCPCSPASRSARSSRSLPTSARRSAWPPATTTRAISTAISCVLPRRSTSSTTPAASRARRTTWRTPVCCSLLRPVRCSPTA